MQGGSSLGQGIGASMTQHKAEAEQNAPASPLEQAMVQTMLRFTQRLKAGEDPQQVRAEASQDPVIRQWQQMQKGGGLAAPAPGAQGLQPGMPPQPQQAPQVPSFPDIGMQGGRPQMGAPGAFDPTRQPQAPQTGMAPQPSLGDVPGDADPRMSPWGIGPQGPKPGMVSGAYMPQPEAPKPYIYPEMRQSLGNVQASAAPQPPMPQGPPRQAFGASPQTVIAPRPMPQPAQPQAPAQAGPAPERLYSRKEFDRVSGFLPTVLAAQGRESTAQVAAQAKSDASQRQTNTQLLIAQMREQGLDQRHQGDLAAKFAGLDVSQQQAVLRGEVTLEGLRITGETARAVANTGAGSRERIAGDKVANAPEREGGAEKELRSLIQAQAVITSKPEWTKDQTAMDTFASHSKRIAELQGAVGRPVGATGQAPARKAAPKPAAKALSTKDQSALDWAERHPEDPRAAQIKSRLGR